MKTPLLIVGLIAMVALGLSSQGKFTVKPRDFPSFGYQIFDVREPTIPPSSGVKGSGIAPAAIKATTQVQSSASGAGSGPAAVPLIQRADRNFEIFCSEMGDKGYRLAQVLPRENGFRAIFEREFPPNTK